MRTINTTFKTFGASLLLLGLKGDSNATEILIDCAESLEEYQGTMAAMSITGPDDTVYPGDISLDENGIVHWVVAARDCGIAGNGSARVDLVDDLGTVVASAEARTIIMKTNMQGVAPDQIANWTEAASVALQEARAALLDLIDTDTTATTNEAARQLAETGRVSAETLRASAETARASAETARATAETARASAETDRATAENTRASAESTRIAAENARVSEFSTIEANAQAALSYIGPSEASSTASAAHEAGSYFIYNGKLYKATADIAIGDTITSGTNCAQVPGGAMGEVSNLKSAITNSENEIIGIKDDLYSAYDVVFEKSFSVSTGGYSGSTKVIDVEIPEGTEYTFKLTSTATKSGNMAVYEQHSDSTSKAISYNYTPGNNLTATATKNTTHFNIAVSGGGFTSNGTVSVIVKYTKHNAESVQQDIINLETNVDAIQDDMDEIYHDFIVEIGYDLISEWVSGDIDSNGNETTSGSYYRTNKIDVDATKTYYLANVFYDDEGTTKVMAWGNNTYGIIHCYSDSAYLGIASVGTGNNSGIFAPLPNTTKVCIAHALVSATTIHMYELTNAEKAREDIIPSDHNNIVEKSFDADTVKRTKVSIGQTDFTANSGMTLADKNSLSPWFLWSNNIISSYIPFEPGSFYIKTVITGLTGIWIKCYGTNKAYISVVSLGNYQTPVKFTTPTGTKFIRIIVAKTNPVLSDLTSVEVFRYTSKNIGYSYIHNIVGVDTLPELPPLALAGQTGGGIISMGHGGVSSAYAEDSIESFYALARFGYSGTEIDIQFTKDHVPVCWHDGSLSVLDGGTSSDHIYDYTLAELDANFDFTTWWDTRGCFRKTVARFEEVCVLARAYGWWLIPDKLTSASGASATDGAVLVAMIKKYGIEDKIIVPHSCDYLLEAFPNNPITLTAMQTTVNEAWINGLLNNTIPEMCHQDAYGKCIVNDGYTVYTSFNWAIIKSDNDVNECADITDLMTKHNVKTVWYSCETPEDIYQLVKYCPKTAIVLTGLYTVPDGMNEYLGLSWGNGKYDLNQNVHL